MKYGLSIILILTMRIVLARGDVAIPENAIWVDIAAEGETQTGTKDHPFKTIGSALTKVEPGRTMVIKQGVYREKIKPPSGTPGKPVTLMSAPGERAVITGARAVTDWKKHGNGTYIATIDWKPTKLYVDNRQQPMAREPNEGWWVAAQTGSNTLTDIMNLPGAPQGIAQGESYIWTQNGNTFFTVKNVALDKAKGRLQVKAASKWMKLKDGDKYYLQNHPSLIDRPGEWAAIEEDGVFTIAFRPIKVDDLQQVEIPMEPRAAIEITGKKHIRILNLDITGSKKDGITVKDAADIEIAGCRAYHNDYTGIAMRNVEQGRIRNNVSWKNGHGVSVSYSKGTVVEENDIAFNGVDGLVVTWKSDDILVRRNFLHDHMLWGHPDNFQTYRGVTNLRVIDNLLITAGQSVMMEETDGCEFRGNMLIGCGAYMLILGHKNAVNYKIHQNTFAFAGYGCINFTAHDYDLRENVLVTGHGGPVFGIKGIKNYAGDRNLLWNAKGLRQKMVLASDKGWHRSFDEFRKTNPDLERHSVYADPGFVNAPVAFRVLDAKQLSKCTRDRLYLRNGTGGFKTGDFVEINFDGVRRIVKETTAEKIRIAPGLPTKPLKGWLVANWGDKGEFEMDLRLRKDSPGAILSEAGKPVGSSIDIQAFHRGDFDGDGRRDIPAIPAQLQPSR
jgi:parallel beta-helix repeat protein